MSGKNKSEEEIDKSQDLSEDVIGILREENEKLKKLLEGSVPKDSAVIALAEAHKEVRRIADATSAAADSLHALLCKLGSAKIDLNQSKPFKYDKTNDGWTLLERGTQRITSVDQIKDLTQVSFLEKGEPYVNGEVMLQRAKERKLDYSQYDAEFLLEHQDEIPKKLREHYLVFPGTVWQDSDGNRSVAHLDWSGDQWYLNCYWLVGGWGSDGRLLSLRK